MKLTDVTSKAQPKTWWQWLLYFIIFVVAPNSGNIQEFVIAKQIGVRYGQVKQAVKQDMLGKKNAICVRNTKFVTKFETSSKITIYYLICEETGDALMEARLPNGKIYAEWVSPCSNIPEGDKYSWLGISKVYGAEPEVVAIEIICDWEDDKNRYFIYKKEGVCYYKVMPRYQGEITIEQTPCITKEECPGMEK